MTYSDTFFSIRPLFKVMVLTCFVIAMLLMTTACAPQKRAKKVVETLGVETQQRYDEVRVTADNTDVLMVDDTPWFGNQAVPVSQQTTLPNTIAEETVVMTFTEPISLTEGARMLQDVLGQRVYVERQRDSEGGDAKNFLPAGGMRMSGGRMLWEGTVMSFLDQLADNYDSEWRYAGEKITISQHQIRTFVLHSLAGDTGITGSVETGSSQNVGLPSQSVSSSANLSIWGEMEDAIGNIMGTRGTASFSPATGTITVAGTPSSLNEVERYIKMQNRMRLRRVAITARVLSVSFSEDYDYNFDLEAVIERALQNQPFIYQSTGGTGTAGGRDFASGILRDVPAGLNRNGNDSVQIVVNALDAVADDVAVAYSGSIVTLSDQPAPLQVSTKRSYVASVSGSATDGAASVTIEPGTIDIGLSLNMFPRVISQDRIMLRIALGITDLVALRDFTSDDNTIQLPEIDSTGFLQNAILNSGETLVLAGFERRNGNNLESGTGLPWNMLAGGQKAFGQGREVRVMLITAKALPEEPIQVITP